MNAKQGLNSGLTKLTIMDYGVTTITASNPSYCSSAPSCHDKFANYSIDSRYSGSLKYGHLDIPAIWLGTEC